MKISKGHLITAAMYVVIIAAIAITAFTASNNRKHEQETKKKAHEAAQTAKLKDCQTKAPYYQWHDKTTTNEGYCFRVRYPSKQACTDDGRQQSASVQPDRYDDAFIRTTTCNDDGTWTSTTYDPAHEEYKQRVEDQKYNTACKYVTSYDYNWSNDMLCTKADGTQFYTSYNGAQAY